MSVLDKFKVKEQKLTVNAHFPFVLFIALVTYKYCGEGRLIVVLDALDRVMETVDSLESVSTRNRVNEEKSIVIANIRVANIARVVIFVHSKEN